MEKTKFTAGVWHVAKNATDRTCVWVGASRICTVDEFPHEGSQDNAKLIAAAPELYEALRIFVDDYERGYSIMTQNMIDKAKSALLKAGGE